MFARWGQGSLFLSIAKLGTALAFIFALLLQPLDCRANPKPVDLRFYGHMCADVPYTVTLNGVSLQGAGMDCGAFADTAWGTAKIVPNKVYTVSTTGAICSAHIPFDKSCYRLFVKGPSYPGWEEQSQIDNGQTFDTQGNPNKDAGGSWQIILTDGKQPKLGGGTAELGSVSVVLDLGALPSGASAGKLLFQTENIGVVTYTPAALQQIAPADVEVLTSGTNIRQIYTWDGLADVALVSGGFAVRFYSLADVGAKGGDGYYTINAGATPFVTWSFVNPDSGATNRVQISEQRPGTATAFNTYAQNGSSWSLETGTGTQVRNTTSKAQSAVGGEPVEVVTDIRYSSPTVFETTITRTFTSLATAHRADKLQSVEYPDGRKDTFTYEIGAYNDTTRTFTAGTGTFLRTTSIHGTTTTPYLLAGKSTQDVLVTNAQRHSVLHELYAYAGTAFALVTQTWHSYDGDGHLTDSTRDGQLIYNATWNLGIKTSETDETGVETTIFYDNDYYFDFVKNGAPATGAYPAQSAIERYGYRGDSRTETVNADSLTTYSETYFDNGRLSYEFHNGLQTGYSYAVSVSGGLITTITYPGGSTAVREEYADGKLKCVTGTAVSPALYYSYGTDGDGNEWTKVNYSSASSTNYLITTVDWLGRTIREEQPAFSGLFVRQYFYNSKGQLWKLSATGLANRLNEFDVMGNQTRTGLDMNGDGSLVLASKDRIEDSDVSFQQTGGIWSRVTKATRYLTDDSAAATLWYQKERLSLPLNTLSEIHSIDPAGNDTIRTTTVDRPAKLVTETVQTPGSNTAAVTITRNGLVQSVSTSSVAKPTTSGYDALGRQTTVTDPRSGTQTVSTYDDDVYASVRVATVTAGDQTVVNTYYSTTESSPGLLKSRSVNGKVTYFDYDSRGQTAHTWGHAAYPTWTEYDSFGRMLKLHTYRNEAGWNSATWPVGAGNGDVTTWGYQASTGLLLSKTDAAGKAVTYTYTPFGRVNTRTSARTPAVTSTYGCNLAGEVESVAYSDSTPSVTSTMSRAGYRKTLTDAAGAHTLSYSPLGQLQIDAIGGTGILANATVAVGYDGLFRKQTVAASVGEVPLLPQQTIHYDPATGRVNDVGDNTVTGIYAYKADSDWLHTVNFKRATTTVMTTTREPDTLSRVLSVVNSVPGQAASGSVFSYHYNARGLRDKLTLADSSYWSYGYDDRAQVTSGQRFWADNTGVGGMQHGYAFDAIGNRTGTNTNGRTATYVPTALNEYASRTVPGAIDVLGNASPSATVTVNNQPTTRKDGYFSKALTVDNVTAAAYPSVNIVGVKSNVGPAGEDAVTNVTGHVFVPKTPEIFTYDDDGNLTGDGRWTYTWDAENRLTSMTSLASAPAESRVNLVFDYDAQGRRIRKTVLRWSTPASAYQQTAQLRFIYDRWNLIAEINAASAPVRTYVLGLDLSGDFQAAGGVGGLLAMADRQASPVKQYFPGYDGNGNITSLIDSGNGALTASYAYGPFGEMLRMTGPAAKQNPFRFSTKYEDDETGLVMYQLRPYSPALGRWLSRDPIEEQGGINLFEMVENNPVNWLDFLGLEWTDPVRTKGTRAVVSCKCGDKVSDLAKKLALDPAEFKSWLQVYGQSVLPSTADEQINTESKFTVPNVVLISYGNMEQGGISTKNIKTAVVANMLAIDTAYTALGYRTINFEPSNEFGNDVSLIQRKVKDKDLAIWAYGGHGDNTGTNLGIGVMAGIQLGYYSASSFQPHHKLSKIIMYACYQGARSADWLTLIAPGGQLMAQPGWLTAGRFSTGGGTPYEDLKVYQNQ